MTINLYICTISVILLVQVYPNGLVALTACKFVCHSSLHGHLTSTECRMTEMFLILTKTLGNLSYSCGYPEYVEVANYQDPSHSFSLLYTAVPCLPTQSGPTVESEALLQQDTSRTGPGREQHSSLNESQTR